MLNFLKLFLVFIILVDVVIVAILYLRAARTDNMKKSKLIVIDGTDGSGKATQTEILVKRLRQELELRGSNKQVVHLEFPNYQSSSATLVKEYLAGQHSITDSYQSSLFYTVDRIGTFTIKDENGESLLDKFNDGNYIFVCDRYTTSNLLHQSTSKKGAALRKYINHMELIEYRLAGLPEPDLVLYLDVTPEVSMKNIKKRYDGDTSKEDLHENIEHLTEVYNNRGDVINKLKWSRIICSTDSEMRTIDDISEEIFSKVSSKLF